MDLKQLLYRRIRLCLLLMVGFLVVSPSWGFEDGETVDIDNIRYTYEARTSSFKVTKGLNKPAEYVIRERISGVPVTRISYYAFKDCSWLESVSVPNGVKIYSGAFSGCSNLQRVFLGSDVQFVGDAFDFINKIRFVRCAGDVLGNFKWSPLTIIQLYNTCPNNLNSYYDISRLTLFDGITSVGGLSGADHLVTVNLPNSLKCIEPNAFKKCYNISHIDLPDSLETIGDWAFSGCRQLKEITIPKSVNSIGSNAFNECFELGAITILNSGLNIDGSTFRYAKPYYFQGPINALSSIRTDSLKSFILLGETGNQTYNTPSLSYVDVRGSLSSASCFAGATDLSLHLNQGYTYSSDFLKGSNVVMFNLPADVHEWNYELPNTNVTVFVESDSLNIKTPLRVGDRMVCVNSKGTKLVSSDENFFEYGGKWYGNFTSYINLDGDYIENPVFETSDADERTLKLYDFLCLEPSIRDYLNKYSNADCRYYVNDSLNSNLYPFKCLFSATLDDLQRHNDKINSSLKERIFNNLRDVYGNYESYAINSSTIYNYVKGEEKDSFAKCMAEAKIAIDSWNFEKGVILLPRLQTAYERFVVVRNRYGDALQKNKASFQPLFDESSKVSSTYSNVFPYIDTEKKNAFTTSLSEAGKALDDYDNEKVVTAQSNLQVAYDAIAVVINRYNSTLEGSKNQLQTLVDNSSKLGKTTYADIYPYIDNTAKSAFSSALTFAQSETVKQTYDVEIVQSAHTQLQAAYDSIVVVINRYNSTLEESKNLLQTLVDNSSKLGKTTYADIYPYIDNTAKGALSSALTSAQSETVKQTYDVEKIQSAQVKLQSAYDQVIALLNTYNNNLTSAKQTLQQQIDMEGTLKSMGEFAFIDANLQKAYEDALTSATTAVSGYDVAAINGAADPLHQAYVKAKNAINSIANELAPAKSILQSQIDKGNAYLENKPYYFTAIYISKLQSRIAEAKNALNNADISSLRQEITILNNLFAELETVITYYKAKEAEMNARFEKIYALMDTLKTIGLYDEEGNIIHPAGDIKGMTLFQFDGTNYSYNRCLEVVRQAQSLAAYAGPSDSGFDESGINEYKSKCNDFIDRFNAEFGVLQAKYQAEREKLREMVQKLQQIKDDNPAAYAAVDNALREKVETQISECSNAEGYAEVGNAYANADFSLSDELQEAIASYNSVVNEMSILIANVSDDCRRIANGASMNAVNTRSDYRKGDGILTSESQITISGNNSKSALLDANANTEVELMSNANTIDLDLNKTYTNVVLAFGCDGQSSLQHHFKVYATNAPQDVETWKLQGEFDNTYARKSQQKYVAKQFVGFDDNYRYLRIEFVPTAQCPQTYIAELRVYHRANKFEGEGDEACTQFFHSLAELKALQESGNISVEKVQKACESYNRFDAFEENNEYATADFKETPSVTYFNANKAMTLPNEVVSSIITSKNGRIVRDTRFDNSHPVPANTAVVLEGVGGCSYYLMPTTDYVASVDGNLLQGMLTDGTTQVLEGEAKYYQFSKGTFAWAKENGAPFSAKAGDVYLAIPTGMEQLDAYDFSSIYGIGDDVPPYTGINELQGLSKHKGIFDLNGRPIKVNDSRELMPGVYIVDGKKIVVK